MSSTPEGTARAAFVASFGGAPAVLARAPGRVELLGNHTDYNGGLVLAAAIDRFTVVVGPGRLRARGPGPLGELRPGRRLLDLDAIERGEPGSWGRYVRGVVWALQECARAAGVRASRRRSPATSRSARGCPARRASRRRSPCSCSGPGWSGRGAAADLDDPPRMELAKMLQRSRERVRRGRVGAARPVLGPLRPRRPRPVPRLPDPRLRAARRWATPRRRSSSATRRPRAGWPTGCTTTAATECERVVAYFRTHRGTEAVRWLRDRHARRPRRPTGTTSTRSAAAGPGTS